MIQTARLDLIAATAEMVASDLRDRERLPALLGARLGQGWPPPLLDVEAMRRIERAFSSGTSAQWPAFYVVERMGSIVIGLSGFKGPPINGEVEIGYTLLPAFHGRGLGTELVRALADYGLAQPDVRCVFAETFAPLLPSRRVLEKNGFSRCAVASEPDVIRYEIRRTMAD